MTAPQSATSSIDALRLVGAALLGSALYALSFPPFELAPLAFVSYAPPLAFLASTREARDARLMGLFFGTLSHALVLRWIWTIFGEASLGLWVVFGLLHALTFWLLFLVKERFGAGRMLALAPFLLLGVECFRSEWWFLRFPWATTGTAQASDPRISQLAEWVGVYGLSLAAMGVGALVAAALGANAKRRVGYALVALGVWLLMTGLGALRGRAIEDEVASEHARPIEVAVVQYETNRVDEALHWADAVPESVELAVFPELAAALIATRAAHTDDPEMAGALSEVARRARAMVAIGATEPTEGGDFFNTLLLVSEEGSTLAHYHKAEPVPLFADGVRSGPSDPIDTALGRLGLCICYDFTHPHVTARALDGAELVVVASGDLASWSALQHEEHRLIARLRAIEHRRFVVRATSSGISAVIDPLGRELVTMGFEEEGVRTATVHLRQGRTLIARAGMALPYACLLLALAVAVWALFDARRGSERAT